MYCQRCYYDLRALPARACPECGRAFDPADADTFSPRGPFRWRWLVRVLLLISVIPLWFVFDILAHWMVAFVALGRRPIAYIDDPGTIPALRSGWLDLSHIAAEWAILTAPLSPLALFGAILLLGIDWTITRAKDTRRLIIGVFAVIASYVLAFLWLFVDPLRIFAWFAD